VHTLLQKSCTKATTDDNLEPFVFSHGPMEAAVSTSDPDRPPALTLTAMERRLILTIRACQNPTAAETIQGLADYLALRNGVSRERIAEITAVDAP